jgi:ABC-type proline/glycine betaine transport system substrate-binding protein
MKANEENEMPRLMLAALALSAACGASAQSMTGPVDITLVRTGWNSDAMAIVTAQPILNPAGCPTADGYVSTSSRPGYQTYLSATLTAFALSTPVVVTVLDSACDGGRPVLIGVNLSH